MKVEKKYASLLRSILDRIDYSMIIQAIRGQGLFLNPWADIDQTVSILNHLSFTEKEAIKLFFLGIPVSRVDLLNELSDEEIDFLIDAEILVEKNCILSTNNLVILMYQQILVVVDILPQYETNQNPDTDVYIGIDSLRLAENIDFKKGASVLDICSGSGIQGLLAARSASKVISVELNPKAAQVARFNAMLNDLDGTIEVREGNLYSVLNDNEKFDYVYANPPFIPVDKDTYYPLCGDGGEDGMDILKEIVAGIPKYTHKDSKVRIFCQCLGSNENMLFYDYLMDISLKEKWTVTNVVSDKLPLNYQAEQLTTIASLVNPDLDKDRFMNSMHNIYEKLDVSYLFSLIINVTVGKGYAFNNIMLANEISLNEKPKAKKDIKVNLSKPVYDVYEEEKLSGHFDEMAADIFHLLDGDHSVSDIVKILYPKYKEKFNQSLFELEVLNNIYCMQKIKVLDTEKTFALQRQI